jgi:SanA protein
MNLKRIFSTLVRRPGRRTLIVMATAVLLPAAAAVMPRVYAVIEARHRVYTVKDVPAQRVAIIFGALIYPDGRLSDMLADRVATGAALYQAGKADVLLMTGDNHVTSYNEPEAMRRYALKLGVPDDAIVLDYAGFRTYDSCYRARDIFQVDAAILVTQRYHLDRALLICRSLGMNAVGVAADAVRPEGYSPGNLTFSQVREFPATTVATLDLLVQRKPRFLGKPLPILAKARQPVSS